ncbi:33897_t:CDS:2, partial [Gigaspora margarita]
AVMYILVIQGCHGFPCTIGHFLHYPENSILPHKVPLHANEIAGFVNRHEQTKYTSGGILADIEDTPKKSASVQIPVET